MQYLRSLNGFAATAVAGLLIGAGAPAQAQSFSEGFNSASNFSNWIKTNRSTSGISISAWALSSSVITASGDGELLLIAPQEGSQLVFNQYIPTNTSTQTVSSWLISPLINGLQNGDTFSFYTTTYFNDAASASGGTVSPGPYSLELRLSAAGSSSNVGSSSSSVGDFTSLLLTVNPTQAASAYPGHWTQYTATVSGLSGPVNGRMAFHEFVTVSGNPGGDGRVIGIDNLVYTAAAAVPEPATWAMALCGIGMLVGLRRRQPR